MFWNNRNDNSWNNATAIIANFSTQFVAVFINSDPDPRKAPIAITGDNVYVTW